MVSPGTPHHPEDRVFEHLPFAVGHDHEGKIVMGHGEQNRGGIGKWKIENGE
jgi:hypothetical protein